MRMVKELVKTLISFAYPNTCLDCGDIIPEGEYFCDCCYEMLNRINHEKQCFKCGLDKKHCDCKRVVYSFDGVTAPFYYADGAKSAVHTLKFGKRQYVAEFFAQQMSLTFKYVYSDMEFDGICYVPLSSKSFRKRGFNQSREIAGYLSDILKIPLIEGSLGCKNKKKSQHETDKSERNKNVKDIFFAKRAVRGRILLVDDIKTTGSTLDECSKRLLAAGASSVYCITGLITEKGIKKG